MSKKIEKPAEVQEIQEQKTTPTLAEELQKKGFVILNAKTREELVEMVNDIPADCKYAAGAIGQSREDGTYVLRVDIVQS